MAAPVGRRNATNCDGSFINNDMQIAEEAYFSDNAPSWRVISEGINVEAVCGNSECEAHQKHVWTKLEPGDKRFGTINVIRLVHRLACPQCEKRVDESTVYSLGFYNCQFRYDGQAKSDSDEKMEDRKQEKLVTAMVNNGFIRLRGGVMTYWKFLEACVDPINRYPALNQNPPINRYPALNQNPPINRYPALNQNPPINQNPLNQASSPKDPGCTIL